MRAQEQTTAGNRIEEVEEEEKSKKFGLNSSTR